jgi:hypothetical protein
MALKGLLEPNDRRNANGWNRRFSGTQPSRPEWLFLPHTGHSLHVEAGGTEWRAAAGLRSITLIGCAAEVPSPIKPPSGCVFHPRCPIAVDSCKKVRPELREVRPDHWVACSEVRL